MRARIFRPAKTAMQSGQARTRDWVLEFEPETAPQRDPLMGWTGGGSTKTQVRLTFETREAAIDYARRNGLPFQVFEPKERRPVIRPRGYGENFAYTRREGWTH